MERIKNAVEKIVARVPMVRGKGEEATKQALVLPLLDSLGFDIWNPTEVCPEYEADFATKKYGQKEKVDLALFLGELPRIYIEVKSADASLDGHEGQLARYFNATSSVSLAVLTNGVEYRFYTDTAEANVMDSAPFHICRFDAVDQGLEVLARFQKSVFSADAIREYARELNYTARIVSFLRDQLDLREREPSETLVRWILGCEHIYDRRVTASVVENFSPIVKNALQIVLRDIVRRSLAALEHEVSAPAKPAESMPQPITQEEVGAELPAAEADLISEGKSKILTTEAELDAFALMKEQFENSVLSKSMVFDATARKQVPLQISYRDTTGYFSVFLNKPSWWIARLVLGTKTQWIGLNVDPQSAVALIPPGFTRLEPSPWAEFRIAVKSVHDIHALGRLLTAAFRKTVEDRIAKSSSGSSEDSGRE